MRDAFFIAQEEGTTGTILIIYLNKRLHLLNVRIMKQISQIMRSVYHMLQLN